MSVFVIADLHLSHTTNKPMDIFGARWENHTERLRENWQSVVSPDDTVIIAGDISWGMRTDDALADLMFIESLNGKKIIAKGNHDYWWQTMKKLYELRDSVGCQSIDFLFNNAYAVENNIICGTRGWVNEFGVKSEDERLIKREAARLEISLNEGMKLKEQYPDNEMIVFLHYPPIFGEFMNLDILDILYRFDITKVYFGHLHNVREEQLDKEYIGIKLNLVACDYVDFVPQLVQ